MQFTYYTNYIIREIIIIGLKEKVLPIETSKLIAKYLSELKKGWKDRETNVQIVIDVLHHAHHVLWRKKKASDIHHPSPNYFLQEQENSYRFPFHFLVLKTIFWNKFILHQFCLRTKISFQKIEIKHTINKFLSRSVLRENKFSHQWTVEYSGACWT